jgi:hypothetical protein
VIAVRSIPHWGTNEEKLENYVASIEEGSLVTNLKGEKNMKKLTCKDFGGPCDAEITGNSFQEMGNNSRMHVMEKIKGGDAAHKAAADKMRNASQEEQMAMMAEYEKKFNEAPNV